MHTYSSVLKQHLLISHREALIPKQLCIYPTRQRKSDSFANISLAAQFKFSLGMFLMGEKVREGSITNIILYLPSYKDQINTLNPQHCNGLEWSESYQWWLAPITGQCFTLSWLNGANLKQLATEFPARCLISRSEQSISFYPFSFL